MGFFETLKSKFTVGKLKKEQIERLQQAIWTAVSDGAIDDRELSYINGFYTESELSQEDFDKLRAEIFRSVVMQSIHDRRVTDGELASLNNLIERLEIAPDVEAWAQQQIQYYREIARIEAGGELLSGNPSGLILQKNELCHLSMPAVLMEERVVSRNYAGGSQGVNIRIMKGVSYRVGQQKGQMTSQSGMVPISHGYFIATSKRLVFSGDRKSVSTPFAKMMDLHVFADGVTFSSSQRQKPVIVKLSSEQESEMAGVLISRLLSEDLE